MNLGELVYKSRFQYTYYELNLLESILLILKEFLSNYTFCNIVVMKKPICLMLLAFPKFILASFIPLGIPSDMFSVKSKPLCSS